MICGIGTCAAALQRLAGAKHAAFRDSVAKSWIVTGHEWLDFAAIQPGEQVQQIDFTAANGSAAMMKEESLNRNHMLGRSLRGQTWAVRSRELWSA